MQTAWLRIPETVTHKEAHSLLPGALGYLVAAGLVTAALIARLLLIPIIGELDPFLLFVPAVLVASATGGFGPGLLATVSSAVLGLYPNLFPFAPNSPQLLGMSIFFTIGV